MRWSRLIGDVENAGIKTAVIVFFWGIGVAICLAIALWLLSGCCTTGLPLPWCPDDATPEPRPTFPPLATATPTRTPTRTPTSAPSDCTSGSVLLRFSGIPSMTDANKDTLNKQCLGGLSFNGSQVATIIHRYCQPTWPVGEWWPAWSLETAWTGGGEARIWPCPGWGRIPGASMSIRVEWEPGRIDATCVETGERQTLRRSAPVYQFDTACEGARCRISGYEPWESVASMTVDGDICAGGPAPTPPSSGLGTDTGELRVRISGLSDALPDSCIVWSLDQDATRGVWWRARSECDGELRCQLKGVRDSGSCEECWCETGRCTSPLATDGVYTVRWSPGSVHVTYPNGGTQEVLVPWPLVPTQLRVAPPWSATRPGADCPSGVSVEVLP